jgi:FkbM family methyltransferase
MKHIIKTFFKSVYSVIPFKREIFSLLKKVYVPTRSIYQHLYFKGWFKVEIEKGKAFKVYHHGFEMENETFWQGITNGWESNSMKVWIELSRISTTIIDVGANTGIYSLVSKTINPSAEVYAFEPVRRVYEKMVDNFKGNNFNIHSFESALSNYNGKATIYDRPTEHIYSVTVNKNIGNPSDTVLPVVIETRTLIDVIEKEKISRIDLIKIDVETHEPEVLEGIGRYLKDFMPFMIIEILTSEVAEKLQRLLADCDYEYYRIYDTKGLKKVDVFFADGIDGYNFLAVPANKTLAFKSLNFQLCQA